jgi:hypothetical protein
MEKMIGIDSAAIAAESFAKTGTIADSVEYTSTINQNIYTLDPKIIEILIELDYGSFVSIGNKPNYYVSRDNNRNYAIIVPSSS